MMPLFDPRDEEVPLALEGAHLFSLRGILFMSTGRIVMALEL